MGVHIVRWFVGLALAVALAVPWAVPAPVVAGNGTCCGICPPNYFSVPLFFYQNHPYLKSATRVDEKGNDNGTVCFRFNQPGGPLFVDDIEQS